MQKNKLEQNSKKLTKGKVINGYRTKLEDYIKNTLDKGYNEEQIKKSLLKIGWSKNIVDYEFNKIKKEKNFLKKNILSISLLIILLISLFFLVPSYQEKLALEDNEMFSPPKLDPIDNSDKPIVKAKEELEIERLQKEIGLIREASTKESKELRTKLKEYDEVLASATLLRDQSWSGCKGKRIIFTACRSGCDTRLEPGTSMLPFIDHTKKLGFCEVDELEVGDIVLIKNPEYPNYDFVLHKIAGFEGEKIITQGYHNEAVDSYKANYGDIMYELGTVGGAIGFRNFLTIGKAWAVETKTALVKSDLPIIGFITAILIMIIAYLYIKNNLKEI